MSDQKELKIKIDLETYEKLIKQLSQMRQCNFPGLEDCKTVEDMISFYIKQTFNVDSIILMETLFGFLKKHKDNPKFRRAFKEAMDSRREFESRMSSFGGSPFDDEEEEEEEEFFEDEMYYDEEEEASGSEQSEGEAYKELRDYHEAKKKKQK